jgi:hypothetical protein
LTVGLFVLQAVYTSMTRTMRSKSPFALATAAAHLTLEGYLDESVPLVMRLSRRLISDINDLDVLAASG